MYDVGSRSGTRNFKGKPETSREACAATTTAAAAIEAAATTNIINRLRPHSSVPNVHSLLVVVVTATKPSETTREIHSLNLICIVCHFYSHLLLDFPLLIHYEFHFISFRFFLLLLFSPLRNSFILCCPAA